MWLYLSLTSAILSGFTAIVMKKCSKDNLSIRLSLIGMLISNIAYVIIGACTTDVIENFSVYNLIKIAPLSIIQSIGYICAILSVKYAAVSTVSPIRKGNTIVTLVLGILILKDTFTIMKLLVSGILILLTILLAKSQKTEVDISENKGIIYAYGFVLFNGISGFLNKVYINIFETPLVVVFYYGLVTIIGVVLYCLITNKWDYINIKKVNHKGLFLLHSALDLGANLCSRFSLVSGQVSTVSVITSSSIVITILASRFILKEKISWKKYLMIIGVYLCIILLALIK